MFYFSTIIMNIHLFKAALWFIGLIGILVIWTVMAEADIQYYDSNIRYTLNSWFATSQVFTAWTIKISDCDGTNQDTCTTITILDRNLWATSNDIESEDSYWYHFQWWNNYWFKPCTSENCKDFPNEESMWTTQVQPGNISIPYTSPIFYIDPIWNKTNWINDASKIDMRWWTTNSTTDLFDSMGDQINFENIESISDYTSSDDRKVTNAVQRQWPCPDWFHVPSLWEYIKVLDMLDIANYQRQKTWTREYFHFGLNIPFAGWRFSSNPQLGSASVQGLNSGTLLRSSSPYSISTEHPHSRAITIIDDDSDGNLGWFYTYRSDAFSVRCFYNEYTGYVKEITNIDISWITDPILWQAWITSWLIITTTPENSIWVTFSWWLAYYTAKSGDYLYTAQCRMWDGIVNNQRCNAFYTWEELNNIHYELRIRYNPIEWYKMADNLNITINWNNSDRIGRLSPVDGVIDHHTVTVKYYISDMLGSIPIDSISITWITLPVWWEQPDISWITSLTEWITVIENNTISWPTIQRKTSDWETDFSKFIWWETYYISIPFNIEYWYILNDWFTANNIADSLGNNASNTDLQKQILIFQYTASTGSSEWESWWGWWSSSISVKPFVWGYSWWGKRVLTDRSNNEGKQGVSSDNTKNDNSTEFEQAYEFAYKNWITTMDTIEKADMEGWVTRIAMAKMLSQYAINVLWQKPANIVVPNFSDIPKELDDEYDYWVTLAYQLWIMWINIPDNKFRPFDLVTRAEFATALSRMLYKLADWDLYYVTHMAKLKEEWIITNDHPEMTEVRWYVMIMLKRSAK